MSTSFYDLKINKNIYEINIYKKLFQINKDKKYFENILSTDIKQNKAEHVDEKRK